MPSAMITGATAGIGAAYSRHLAAAGHSLVIVARDGDRLEEARKNLLAQGASKVEVLIADLTVPEELAVVQHRLRDAANPVDLLINNAGMGLGKWFEESTEAELLHQLNLNVTAVMLLAHAALPGMRQRGHGALINVASIAAFAPSPGATYSASKAWVLSFSEGLAEATAGTGVRVQALCPGYVRTEFHQRANLDMSGKPDALYVDIDLLVQRSLADLRADRTVSIPGALYRGLAAVVKLAPRRLVRWGARKADRRGR